MLAESLDRMLAQFHPNHDYTIAVPVELLKQSRSHPKPQL